MNRTFAAFAALFCFSIFSLVPTISNAQTDNRYLAVNVIYQANGELLTGGGAQVFESAQECDRFIQARINAAIQQVGRGAITMLGNSVLMTNDDTGYFWYGCIHPTDYSTAAYIHYINVRMTAQLGRQMKRFPNLSG